MNACGPHYRVFAVKVTFVNENGGAWVTLGVWGENWVFKENGCAKGRFFMTCRLHLTGYQGRKFL